MTNKRLTYAIVTALALVFISISGRARATPTDSATVWSFGNLYVANYRASSDGTVRLLMHNSAGNQFSNWTDSAGTAQCPNQPTVRIHYDHPLFERLSETAFAAALARKPVHIWFEATSGVCWVKGISVDLTAD